VSAGYFTATACTANLLIINTVNSATIYTQAVVTSALIQTVILTRFVFPTVRF